MAESEDVPLKAHPIQLISVSVVELYIHANTAPDISVGVDAAEGGVCSIGVGHGGYNPENHTISVALKLEIGQEEVKSPDTPFSLRIELVGTFAVDESRFKQEHIVDFARRNAPYIMMPYLREHAFALTAKCGFRPIILPLTQVPVQRPEPK